MTVWKHAPVPLQSHRGEEDQAAEPEGFHSGSPALCLPGSLLRPPVQGGFARGRDVSGWLAVLLCGVTAAPRQQPGWWQGAP